VPTGSGPLGPGLGSRGAAWRGAAAGVDGTKPIWGEVVWGEYLRDGESSGSTTGAGAGGGFGFSLELFEGLEGAETRSAVGFYLTESGMGGSLGGQAGACPALRIEEGFRGFGGQYL
jgi:hypothetical protein